MSKQGDGCTKKDLLVFLGFTLLTEGGGALVGFLTSAQFVPGGWFDNLVKPSWNPPNWIFGPMWTTLYLFIAIAAFLIWKKIGFSRCLPWTLFFIQLALNFAWPFIFFLAHELAFAFIESGVMAMFILFTLIIFMTIDKRAGALFLPYLAWVSFATYLAYTLWRLNPDTETLFCEYVGQGTEYCIEY